MTDAFRVCGEVRCKLGEGPLWSPREQAVYWVDILQPAVHRLSFADRSSRSWDMPEKIGWLVERRERPGFIAGLQSGFVELTLDPLRCRAILDPEPDYPDNRMNDGKVDALGRIWAGTMDTDIRKATGSLYRLDADFRCSRQDSGYLVTNGPAFDAPRNRVYHNDTGRGVVYRFDMTPSGELRDKREFIRFPEKWGRPDGMTVDADGGLWIAHWGGGRVTRFTPDGDPERHIPLPASQITSCVFAGENLERMFVTSAAADCPDEALAGALFEVDPGARGLPANLFAG